MYLNFFYRQHTKFNKILSYENHSRKIFRKKLFTSVHNFLHNQAPRQKQKDRLFRRGFFHEYRDGDKTLQLVEKYTNIKKQFCTGLKT